MEDIQAATATQEGRSLPVRAAVAVVLSVLANVAIVLAVDAANLVDPFMALTVPPVAFLSAVGAAGAAGVYWFLQRRMADPDGTFRKVAAAVLVLSLFPDLGILFGDPEATVGAVLVLMVMHVVVAAIAVGLLSGFGGERAREDSPATSGP